MFYLIGYYLDKSEGNQSKKSRVQIRLEPLFDPFSVVTKCIQAFFQMVGNRGKNHSKVLLGRAFFQAGISLGGGLKF